MSSQERAGDDAYEAQNDATGQITEELKDDSYVTQNRQVNESKEIPVVSDTAGQNELDQNDFPANSDAQLEADDKMAIDQDNILDSRTRGAKPTGSLSEGPDEDDLPAEVVEQGDGTSSMTKGMS